MYKKYLILTLLCFVLLGASCTQPITVPQIAETLGPVDINSSPVSQTKGFGALPKLQFSQSQDNNFIDFNTTLPSLQPTIAVLRLPATNLKITEFQNLTQAIGLPAGLIGNQTQNLSYNLSWTNQKKIVWQFFSNEQKITFNNSDSKAEIATAETWLGKPRLMDAVDMFLKQHGINEQRIRNIQIIPRWSAWLDQLDQIDACVPLNIKQQIAKANESSDLFHVSLPLLPNTYTPDCVKAYPTRIPVSFEKLIDGWNVVDKDGNPEYGGQLIINSQNGELESGWLYLPSDPQRSDYPAITTEEMKNLLKNGGLAGPLPGDKEIDEINFAFVRLPQDKAYTYEYLVPAIVAEARRTVDGSEFPYRIVVPLIKQ